MHRHCEAVVRNYQHKRDFADSIRCRKRNYLRKGAPQHQPIMIGLLSDHGFVVMRGMQFEGNPQA